MNKISENVNIVQVHAAGLTFYIRMSSANICVCNKGSDWLKKVDGRLGLYFKINVFRDWSIIYEQKTKHIYLTYIYLLQYLKRNLTCSVEVCHVQSFGNLITQILARRNLVNILYIIVTPFNTFANRADPDQTALVRAV